MFKGLRYLSKALELLSTALEHKFKGLEHKISCSLTILVDYFESYL